MPFMTFWRAASTSVKKSWRDPEAGGEAEFETRKLVDAKICQGPLHAARTTLRLHPVTLTEGPPCLATAAQGPNLFHHFDWPKRRLPLDFFYVAAGLRNARHTFCTKSTNSIRCCWPCSRAALGENGGGGGRRGDVRRGMC